MCNRYIYLCHWVFSFHGFLAFSGTTVLLESLATDAALAAPSSSNSASVACTFATGYRFMRNPLGTVWKNVWNNCMAGVDADGDDLGEMLSLQGRLKRSQDLGASQGVTFPPASMKHSQPPARLDQEQTIHTQKSKNWLGGKGSVSYFIVAFLQFSHCITPIFQARYTWFWS